MQWALIVQTSSTLLVVGSFGMSEMVLRLLDAFPGWRLAWYLALGPFRPFEQVRDAPQSLLHTFVDPAVPTHAFLLALLALLAHLTHSRLVVALLAHLCCALSLSVAGGVAAARPVQTSLIARLEIIIDGGWLLVLVLGVSCMACASSHLAFAAAIRREIVSASAAPINVPAYS